MIELYYIGNAVGTTLSLALYSLIIGFILSIIFVALELSKYYWVVLFSTVFITILRSLPEILVILFIYFGISQFLITLSNGFTINLGLLCFSIILPIENFNINPFVCSIIALSILYAVHASQTLQGALKAISQGQWESGQALGMHNRVIFLKIIMPQMWQYALPGLGNQWLILLKDTALVSLISVNDLMLQTKSIISVTQQPFTWYLIAASIYLIITLLSQYILYMYEKYIIRFYKKEKPKLW